MWNGFYEKWNPIPHLADERLYVEGVHDDWEGFRIWIGSENRKAGLVVVIRFENRLLYTASDEGHRLSAVKNPEPLKFPHLFWKVSDSELVREFHRQSVGITEDRSVTHYAFLGVDDCIDVLSVEDPLFSNVIDEDHFRDWYKAKSAAGHEEKTKHQFRP